MSDIPLTITLELGDLDKNSGEYPLRLLLAGKKASKELAIASIPKDKLHRTKLGLGFDPITKFLEESDPSDDFQEIGEYLYGLLHQGDIARKWDDFKAANKRLRVQLDIKPKDLAAFPWELVSDGLDKLTINPKYTLVRKYQPPQPVEEIDSESWPIRVLIVIGAKDDDAAVQPWPEIRRIESELHKKDRQEAENRLVHRVIDIQVLRRPSLRQLEIEYTKFKPHVFHFIGHGEPAANDKAHLVINWLNTVSGKFEPIKWRSDHIYVNFQGWGPLPRFVLINACRSDAQNQTAEDVRKQAWTIGDVFRRLGVPAVLTMQADINGEAAGVFAGTLYKSLAELDPLDTALAHARRAIANVASLRHREWAIPVLTLAIPPEDVLRFKPKVPDSRLLEIKDCTIFKKIDFFSDRIDERRALIGGFYPIPPQTPDKDLIIVKGKEEAGKSWLVTWCMEACALLNHDIRYVEVGGEVTRSWLDVLLQIRDGDDSKNDSLLIHKPLNEQAFHQFNWELEYRFKGQEPPSVWDRTIVPPRKINIADPNARWTPKFAQDTFDSFQKALIQAAEINNPLIIVLDHFTKNAGITESEMINFLIPQLIEPSAKHKFREVVSAKESRSVKFILVLSDTEFQKFKIGDLVSSYYEIPLVLFNPDNAEDIMLEFMRYRWSNWPEEEQKDLVRNLLKLVRALQPEWTPKGLVSLMGGTQ